MNIRKSANRAALVDVRCLRGGLVIASICGVASVVTLAGKAQAYVDVTSLTTTFSTVAAPTTVTGVTGEGTNFLPSNKYTIDYEGGDQAISSINAGSTTYVPTRTAKVTVQRESSGPDTDLIWYESPNASASSNPLILDAPKEVDVAQAFSGNNLLVGADNIFGNTGNTDGNNTNIERVDMVYSSPIVASAADVFSVFDRGQVGQHDGVEVAAILSVNAQGVPTNYGKLVSIGYGTWGNTALEQPQNYVVTLTNDPTSSKYASDSAQHPTDVANPAPQTIGGVLFASSELVPTGTPIYGYSIFAPDTAGSGTELTQYTNSTYFPTNTNSINVGGLDPLATTAMLYVEVPEPASAALLGVGLTTLAARRRRVVR